MDTYVKRVEAMQINAAAAAIRAVRMLPGAKLLRDGTKIKGVILPGPPVNGSTVAWIGQWVWRDASGNWSHLDNMDGWEREDAT